MRGSRPLSLDLDNGLAAIVQQHGAADVAAVQLWMRVGARHETAGEAGFAHFVEHLLFKGTPSRGPGIIDATISGLGGEMNAATSQDFTYYHVVLPARYVETALDVVADAATRASFDPGELDRERRVVLEEIRRSHDNPSAYLWRVLAGRHFPGHPYGRPVLGAPEIVEGASREALVEFFRCHYAPNRASLVVVGQVDPEGVLGQIGKVFAGWEPRVWCEVSGAAAPEAVSVARVEEGRALRQAYVAMAWRGPVVPDPDVYAVDLLTMVLGHGRSSRLHQALRERRRLVSSVGARLYTQHAASTVLVTARTTAAPPREVEAAALAEIEGLRDSTISEGEMTRALTAVEAAHAFGHETAEGVAYAYGSAQTVWTLDFELTYLDAVRRVTREQVREAARRYLVPDRFTVAALTPESSAP